MFEHIKVDDTVTRMLAGTIPMKLKVSAIEKNLIHCGPWMFDRTTGHEYDPDIPILVSYLVDETKPDPVENWYCEGCGETDKKQQCFGCRKP